MKINTKTKLAMVLIAGITYMSPAQAALNCNVVERLGNGSSNLIRQQMNASIAGTSTRISRRKTLIIHGARHVSFRGCQLRSTLGVTLKRKIRRNAVGTVRITANVRSFSRGRVCLSNVRVRDVDVSRTGIIGESIYRLAANKAIKNNQCFRVF